MLVPPSGWWSPRKAAARRVLPIGLLHSIIPVVQKRCHLSNPMPSLHLVWLIVFLTLAGTTFPPPSLLPFPLTLSVYLFTNPLVALLALETATMWASGASVVAPLPSWANTQSPCTCSLQKRMCTVIQNPRDFNSLSETSGKHWYKSADWA